MINVAYYCAQAGMLISALFPIGILHVTSQQTYKPPFYYSLGVYAIAITSAFAFSFQVPLPVSELPIFVYLLETIIGLHFLAIFVFYQFGIGPAIPTKWSNRINVVVGAACAAGMLVAVGLWLYRGVETNTKELRREIRTNRSLAAADTSRLAELQAQNDTLRAQVAELTRQNAEQGAQLSEANQRIADVLEVVIELKNAIRRLGANVERSRKENIYIPPPVRSQPPESFSLSPDKVRPKGWGWGKN